MQVRDTPNSVCYLALVCDACRKLSGWGSLCRMIQQQQTMMTTVLSQIHKSYAGSALSGQHNDSDRHCNCDKDRMSYIGPVIIKATVAAGHKLRSLVCNWAADW